MRRASMLFFGVCWIVAVASLGLRAGYPSAQPQAPASGGQRVAPGGQRVAPGGQRVAPGEQRVGKDAAPRFLLRQEATAGQAEQGLVKQYCVTCHNARAL